MPSANNTRKVGIGDEFKMIFEKSCGAIVLRHAPDKDGRMQRYVLMIKHSQASNHSFPKGHVEKGETEIETAVREVLEETGVSIKITSDFRHPVYYKPRPGAKKEVVYFLALTEQVETTPREGEVVHVEWVEVDRATRLLAHENDRRVLSHAIDHFNKKGV